MLNQLIILFISANGVFYGLQIINLICDADEIKTKKEFLQRLMLGHFQYHMVRKFILYFRGLK